VPAILRGQAPVTRRPALADLYPDDLFQVIDQTKSYEMVMFEPITRMSPRSQRHLVLRPNFTAENGTLTQKLSELLRALVVVYPRLILTMDVPIEFPSIPKAWMGASGKVVDDLMSLQEFESGQLIYPALTARQLQLDHFLKCLQSSERPRFHFLHAVIPHFPWVFVPTGEQYFSEGEDEPHPIGTFGDLHEMWNEDEASVMRSEYRYRLQVGFVDRYLGQVMDRMKEIGIFDKCLMIVVADHGVSFRPNHSRRNIDSENVADIFSVPLFIKLPGQKTAGIDDRNVETIDIFPTIIDILGIDLPLPVDGVSIHEEQRSKRKTIYYEAGSTVIEETFPQREAAIKRKTQRYGKFPLERLPPAASSHPEWHGRSIDKFTIDRRPIRVEVFDNRSPTGNVLEFEKIAAHGFVSGRFRSHDISSEGADVALFVDGTLYDTCRTSRQAREFHEFQFVIPNPVARSNESKLEIFVIEAVGESVNLRPTINTREPDVLNN
jgi:hypothetical protein